MGAAQASMNVLDDAVASFTEAARLNPAFQENLAKAIARRAARNATH